jgi:hypothetical protein
LEGSNGWLETSKWFKYNVSERQRFREMQKYAIDVAAMKWMMRKEVIGADDAVVCVRGMQQ